jgi:hypothetical protein
MERERLGRVVAVALLALLTPVACAALGVGTPSASGLPPSSGSASPAVQPDDGEEAPTAEAFLVNTWRTGLWADLASRQPQRHASNARDRVFVSSDHEVIDRTLPGQVRTEPDTDAPLEPALGRSTTETALGPATSKPEVTPVATRYLRSR